MKLVIQIPAYNEGPFIKQAIDEIRNSSPIKPFCHVMVVVINDGSTDNTLNVLKRINVQHIVNLPKHLGLAFAFKEGLKYSLSIGADIIVNTDADLQYCSDEIKSLVKPILYEKADMVIGDRQLKTIANYPMHKSISQIIGNTLLSSLFGTTIKDSTSGFRAFTKDTAKLLVSDIESNYTYTIESICILLNKGKSISFVPIHARGSIRPSRLIKNKAYYVLNYLFIVLTYFLKKCRTKICLR